MTCDYCKRTHSELSCPGCGAATPNTSDSDNVLFYKADAFLNSLLAAQSLQHNTLLEIKTGNSVYDSIFSTKLPKR